MKTVSISKAPLLLEAIELTFAKSRATNPEISSCVAQVLLGTFTRREKAVSNVASYSSTGKPSFAHHSYHMEPPEDSRSKRSSSFPPSGTFVSLPDPNSYLDLFWIPLRFRQRGGDGRTRAGHRGHRRRAQPVSRQSARCTGPACSARLGLHAVGRHHARLGTGRTARVLALRHRIRVQHPGARVDRTDRFLPRNCEVALGVGIPALGHHQRDRAA